MMVFMIGEVSPERESAALRRQLVLTVEPLAA